MMISFGVDLGMGACKLAGADGFVHLPSQVAVGDGRQMARLAGMKAQKPPLDVVVNGHSFYVGDNAHQWGRPIEAIDYERLTGSPEMLAIFYGAFTRWMQAHGRISEPVTLYVGMPLAPLMGETAKETVAAVRGWMQQAHSWEADGETWTLPVEAVRVTGQATGALYDYLLDDSGRFTPAHKGLARREIGVISIGFNTIELLVVKDTQPVPRFTTGHTAGARRLLELLNGRNLYSLGELDTQLRDGGLDVQAALPVWAREVAGCVERAWGDQWPRFAQIVVVGGGAVLLNGELTTRFRGKACVPDAPVTAVARGLYKMALMQARRGK